jgi:hypothetical protein
VFENGYIMIYHHPKWPFFKGEHDDNRSHPPFAHGSNNNVSHIQKIPAGNMQKMR